MTPVARRLVSLFFASSSAVACGTIVSRLEGIESDAARVYGGVAQDATIFGAIGKVNVEEPGTQTAGMYCLILPFALLDLPFSFVADTLMLPVTIPEAVSHDEKLAAFHELLDAAGKGDVEAARKVVAQEPDTVEYWNEKDETALKSAARAGHLAMVQFLVSAGADVGFRHGQPLQAALFAKRHDVAIWLHDSIPDDGDAVELVAAALERALVLDRPDVATFTFQQRWFPPDGAVELGQSLLTLAARDGKLGVMRAALDAGANVNHVDEHGSTALHRAVWLDQREAVRLLLSRGPDLEVVDDEGRTALANALFMDRATIALLLRAAGAREPK